MSQTVVLRNTVDAWTSPDRAQSMFQDTRLFVHSNARAFVYFARPKLPAGSQINSATLTMMPGRSVGTAAVTVDLHRLTSKFEPNSLTWAGQPTVGTLVDSLNRSSWSMIPPEENIFIGEPMEFDVTSDLQFYVDGGEWFGWRVSTTSTDVTQYINGGNSPWPMELSIEYTTPPARPIDLFPNSNARIDDPSPKLSWTTPGGASATQLAFQIQIATDANFADIVHTTAEINSGASSYDMSESAGWVDLTEGQSRWWRVRIKGDSGIWSLYSLGAQFTYGSPSVVNVTAPSGVASDPTPDIVWTFDGDMVAWQILLFEKLPWQQIPQRLVYDSGIQYGVANSFTLPAGAVKYANTVEYRALVRVWESGDLVSLAGTPTYKQDGTAWTWDPTGATPPVAGELVGHPEHPYTHHRFLRWQYTGLPARSFFIAEYRNGDLNNSYYVDAAAAREGATQWYRTPIWLRGRADSVFYVLTIMPDGSGSAWAEALAVEARIDYEFPWITSVYDSNKHFCLVNYDIDPGLSEINDVVVPVSGPSYLVQYSLQKFNGSASGEIAGGVVQGLSAEDMLSNFLWMREHNPRVRFSWQDQFIDCYIYNTAFKPIANSDGTTDYAVSFDFVQV